MLRSSVSAILLCAAFVCTGWASQDSIGPNGINSSGLGLTGSGISIGQVEEFRPGKVGYDNAASCCNANIVPTDVFVEDRLANVNERIDSHSIWVAGVLISSQTATSGTHSPPVGVAQQASLFSSSLINDADPQVAQENAAVAAENLAKSGADIHVMNMSFGIDLNTESPLDGTSTLTEFVDWSAGNDEDDMLYVVAGNESILRGVPTDNYNGMTVGISKKNSGVFRQVSIDNDYSDEPLNRTFTDLIAPGDHLDLAGPDGTFAPVASSSGTSFAAPHVAGTVALLQQFATTQISTVGGTHWTASAVHHEVMKAVLMNSADKIQGVLGMDRTVLRKDGSMFSNSPTTPLDQEMGTGELDAKRALQQFTPGQYATGNVPLIAWDYGFISNTDVPNKYVLNQQLNMGDYISVTLDWDRTVRLDPLSPPFDSYKPGDNFVDNGFYNLDLYVVHAGATSTAGAIAMSISTAYNVEHIFAPITIAGNYEIWVVLNDQSISAAENYALAWWVGGSPSHVSMGDYNGDGIVNQADYDMWRSDFGSNNAAADGNGNGVVDSADYVVWRDHLGQSFGSGAAAVPEPSLAIYLSMVIAIAMQVRRRSSRNKKSPRHYCRGLLLFLSRTWLWIASDESALC